MKTVMSHDFSLIPSVKMERSLIKLDHGHKSTFNVGYLVPFYRQEILPGDTFSLSATLFGRLASPLSYPIMDNMFIDTFYFFVPNRLLWEHWQQFMGERDTLAEIMTPTDYLVPVLSDDGDDPLHEVSEGSLSHYLGLPLTANNAPSYVRDNLMEMNALYHRAYNLIWNEFFRDQNLQEKVTVDTSDGPDQTAYTLLKRCKKHDYFTSALPWLQKGPAIQLPLGGTAPVVGDGINALRFYDGTEGGALYQDASQQVSISKEASGMLIGATVSQTPMSSGVKAFGITTNAASSGLVANLSTATASTINELREAFQLQRMLERDARGGTRYTEIIKAHFNVISPDYRLQRPEYLGGSSDRIHVNPVQQTSESTANSKQGNQAAFATFLSNGGFNKSFTEHGVILGIVNVRADITYQQGIPRDFMRRTRLDYYWPALSHLGEQEVYKGEIYAQGDDGTLLNPDKDVWAYQERYAEYRYKPSQISGLFASESNLPLDAWHLSEELSGVPPLNSSWIQDATPITRVIAVTSQPQIIFDSYLRIRAARCMPLYSIPGLIDHF